MTEEIDREERERRHHILQWTRFMVLHLEGTDEVRHLSYTDALARLRDPIDGELASVRSSCQTAVAGGESAGHARSL